jgi:hypothetical protein
MKRPPPRSPAVFERNCVFVAIGSGCVDVLLGMGMVGVGVGVGVGVSVGTGMIGMT